MVTVDISQLHCIMCKTHPGCLSSFSQSCETKSGIENLAMTLTSPTAHGTALLLIHPSSLVLSCCSSVCCHYICGITLHTESSDMHTFC